jgi:hypothetical protein
MGFLLNNYKLSYFKYLNRSLSSDLEFELLLVNFAILN